MALWSRFKHHFNTVLGLSIWAYRSTLKFFCTVILFSIHSSSWGEDKGLALRKLFHNLQQIHRSHNIILIIVERHFNRLSSILLSSKVNNSFNRCSVINLFLKNRAKELKIKDVSLLDMNVLFFLFSDHLKESPNYILSAVGKIINDDDFDLVFLENFSDGVCSNIA